MIGSPTYVLACQEPTAPDSDINQTAGSAGRPSMWKNRRMHAAVCLLRAASLNVPATWRNEGIPRWILLGRIRLSGRKRVMCIYWNLWKMESQSESSTAYSSKHQTTSQHFLDDFCTILFQHLSGNTFFIFSQLDSRMLLSRVDWMKWVGSLRAIWLRLVMWKSQLKCMLSMVPIFILWWRTMHNTIEYNSVFN